MERFVVVLVACAVAAGCGSQIKPRPPIQEVPIGTAPDAPPADSASTDGDAGASALDAALADDSAADAGVEAGVATDTPPEEPPKSAKKKGGKGGARPVAINPTSSGGGDTSQGAGSARAALEAKVFSGQGSRAEVSQLMRICVRDKDRECLAKIKSAAKR